MLITIDTKQVAKLTRKLVAIDQRLGKLMGQNPDDGDIAPAMNDYLIEIGFSDFQREYILADAFESDTDIPKPYVVGMVRLADLRRSLSAFAEYGGDETIAVTLWSRGYASYSRGHLDEWNDEPTVELFAVETEEREPMLAESIDCGTEWIEVDETGELS